MATIQDNKEEIDQSADRSGVTAPGPLQTVGTAAPGGMATPDKRPQGSGRFTNLQKYIQANQGAGQRIAGEVGKGVKKEIGKEEKEAGEYYKNLGSAIAGARKVTEEGAKYNKTLQDIGENVKAAKPGENKDLGVQQFVNDPGFQQFQNIQAGRGIDERLLALRQQQAAKESGEYVQTAQNAQQQLGSEGGRFNLLRKTFGGAARPGYTTGQQRLDQTLLAQQGLGGLRSDLSQDLKSATEQQRLAQQAAGTVSGLASEERGLVESMQGLTGDIQTGYESNLEQQLENLKKQHPEAAKMMEQKLTKGTLTQSDIENLGLTTGTQLYDVKLQDFLKEQLEPTISSTMTPEQLARYKAVQQLSGRSGRIQGLDESKIGTYSPYQYDVDGLQQAIEESQAQFGTQSKQAADALKAFTGYYAPMLNKDLSNWGKDPLFTNVPQTIQSSQDVADVQNLINRFQSEFGGKSLGGATGGRLGFDQWSQVSGNVDGQHSRTYDAADLAARSGYRSLLDLLPELKRLQTGRTVQAAPEDMETGGNFNVG